VGEFDAIGRDGVVFPREGERYAVAVQRGESWSALVDGEIQGEYKNLLPGITFSNDGSRLAFIAGRGAGMFMVIDGEESSVRPGLESLVFSPDGRRMALVLREGEQRRVLIDGKPERVVEAIDPGGVRFSDDGRHYYYGARKGEQRYIVFDGKPGPTFDRIGAQRPSFLAGGHFAYSARTKGGEQLVFDGEVEQQFRRLRHFEISPDGTRHVYFGLDGEVWTLVENGAPGRKYPRVSSPPVFSSDSKRLAFIATDGREHALVVDGIPGKTYDFIQQASAQFAPGTHHVCYIAAISDKRYLVVDDLEIDKDYDGFLNEATVIDGNSVLLRARRRGVFFLVDLQVQ